MALILSELREFEVARMKILSEDTEILRNFDFGVSEIKLLSAQILTNLFLALNQSRSSSLSDQIPGTSNV